MISYLDNEPPKRRAEPRAPGHWRLQEAKARFSELVRRVHKEGPQHVTVHGRDEVVVVSAADYARLQGSASGAALIEAMQASPFREVDLTQPSVRAPVRDVVL